MQTRTLLSLTKLLLPLSFCALGVAGTLRAGDALGAGCAGAAGLALGLVVHYLLKAVAVLVGHLPDDGIADAGAADALELDRQLVTRSLRDVELDQQQGKLDVEQADELLAPLGEQLERLDRDIERAAGEADPIGREILARVEERLAAGDDGRAHG